MKLTPHNPITDRMPASWKSPSTRSVEAKQSGSLPKLALAKTPTGISGLDDVTYGGLPTGRTTLVCGGPGCGKTLLGIEFIVRGVTQFHEPGVFLSFEETANELTQNVSSLGFNLGQLVAEKKLVIDHVEVDQDAIADGGNYNLDGLFIRLGHAIDSIQAKRVVIDTVESLGIGLNNESMVRTELRRLYHWLKNKGVTTIITGERGETKFTRLGLEEYVSDCVILLDHRVMAQTTTRRLRVVKYRGSIHGTNEYPFLIDVKGISVWPVTSLKLETESSLERISSGVARLDFMLGGKGYFRGSNVLITGTAGTGKTSLVACFADSCCRQGKRGLFFSFEESPDQIQRNMRSIGMNLEIWVEQGLLQFHSTRTAFYGLEMHLAQMVKAVVESKPEFVIIDPISSLGFTENEVEQKCTLMILIDFLKTQGITALFTELTFADATANQSQAIISSQCDTWLVLSDLESNGEHNRGLHVLKSRGMAHSNQIREFKLTDDGIELADVYVGPGGILVGSAKVMQEARDEAARLATKLAMDKQCRELKTQIDILQSELKAKTIDLARTASEGEKVIKRDEQTRQLLRQVRHADFSPDNTGHSQRKPGPEIARPSRRGKSMATKSPARSSRQRPKRTTAAKPVKLHSVEIPTKGGSRQPSMSKKAV